jgi:TBC domain-containing protein kinase-like protein
MDLGIKAFFASPAHSSFLCNALYKRTSFDERSTTVSIGNDDNDVDDLCQHAVRTYELGSAQTTTTKRQARGNIDEQREEEGAEERTLAEKSSNSVSTTTNGRQVTPALRIVGRFQRLKQWSKQNESLCEYVTVVKGSHDRLFVVSEHYGVSLASENARLKRLHGRLFSVGEIRRFLFEMLGALRFLARRGIVHRNLSSDNVLLDASRSIKLSDYGMYYLTESGANVNFAIGTPRTLAPETVAGGPWALSSAKADIWSLGIVVLDMVSGRSVLAAGDDDDDDDDDAATAAVFDQIIKLCGHEPNARAAANAVDLLTGGAGASNVSTERLLSRQHRRIDQLMDECGLRVDFAPELRQIVQACLTVSPRDRPSADDLLRHPWFDDLVRELPRARYARAPILRCLLTSDANRTRIGDDDEEQEQDNDDITLLDIQSSSVASSSSSSSSPSSLMIVSPSRQNANARGEDPLKGKSLEEIFHFWQLTGGDLETRVELQLRAPIMRLPSVVRTDGSVWPRVADEPGLEPSLAYDDRIAVIELDALRARLRGRNGDQQLPERFLKRSTGQLPPIAERERDIDYQRFRVQRFRELLADWPCAGAELRAQARIDVPPMLRAEVWRRVLGVDDAAAPVAYARIDNESEGPADHQIALDIPRCHQYHHLLSSPDGHAKFRRVLKAWVADNPSLTYWQGLDSLLAPFLVRNFDSEALAFACLSKLTSGPLRRFFGRDNSAFLQQHLLVFRQALAFADPELAVHLHRIGFEPELFGIPWFLTLFTHIFSLDKIYPIWDTLLLDPAALPLHFATAILSAMREQILTLDFNACLLFVSNLPAIDIDKCLAIANTRHRISPPSLALHLFRDGNVEENKVGQPQADSGGFGGGATRLSAKEARLILAKRLAVASEPWHERLALGAARESLAPSIDIADVALQRLRAPFVLLDIRPSKQFQTLRFPGSVNLDHKDPSMTGIDQHRASTIVIIGNAHAVDNSVVTFANALVERLFPRVCILNGGIDAVRHCKQLLDSIMSDSQRPAPTTASAPTTTIKN